MENITREKISYCQEVEKVKENILRKLREKESRLMRRMIDDVGEIVQGQKKPIDSFKMIFSDLSNRGIESGHFSHLIYDQEIIEFFKDYYTDINDIIIENDFQGYLKHGIATDSVKIAIEFISSDIYRVLEEMKGE